MLVLKWFVCADINVGQTNSSNTQEHGARRDQTAAKQDLGRKSGPKMEGEEGIAKKKWHSKNFTICIFHQLLLR